MSIKDHVRGKSYFQSYRAGYFYYKTDTDFEFVVPLEDIEGATVNNEEKSMFFMRWIKKQLSTDKTTTVKEEDLVEGVKEVLERSNSV